jgi:hypothetical protein
MKEGKGSWKAINCTEVIRIKSGGKNLFNTRCNWKQVNTGLALCEITGEYQNEELTIL